jgi:hypothetical protein
VPDAAEKSSASTPLSVARMTTSALSLGGLRTFGGKLEDLL